jgi:RNA polymerase sigma-70 factor (ECF subfamily)
MLGAMDEERIASLLAAGDPEGAATAALERYGPSVLGYLCSLLDEDDAHDAFSLFAEDLWRGLPSFRGECSLRAWAFRLAWHASCRVRRDPYRARGRRLPSSAASRLAASVAASTVYTGSRREGLRRLREQLEPEDQTLLVLRVDRELEWDEVAAVLSGENGEIVTAPALRKRFERLKDKLAELARAEGLLGD